MSLIYPLGPAGSVNIGSAAAAGATWTATDNPAEGASGSTVTFTSAALGATDPSRGTIVVVSTESVVATSVTVGGFAMTKVIEESTAISSLQIWAAFTDTLGTTANIVVSGSGTMTAPKILVGRFTGISVVTTVTSAVNTGGADPATITATVPTGGFGIAAITTNPTTTGTWSNATVDYRVNTSSSKTVSLSHTSTVGSQTPSYAGLSGGISHMVMACFAPTAPYTAQGVRFASTQLVASSLSGMADGQKGIISFWFKFVGGDGNFQVLFEGRLQCFSLFRDTANKWNFTLLAPGGGVALNFVGTTTYSSSMTQWVHFLSSWDLGGSGAASFYVNDVVNTTPSFTGGLTLNYLDTDTNVDFGARNSIAIPMNCDIADFYFNTTEFLDFNNPSHRRRFIDGTGKPVDLGATGATPTGTAPMILFKGPVASWHTNKGTGGGFSIASGSLSASATNP